MSQIAARAWIHRRDQLEVRRELCLTRGTRNRDAARLQRFAQRFEDAPLEFRQLVEKQDAVMRERDLSRSRVAAAAHERDRRSGMMRSTERALLPPFEPE